jgi:hypothetical protein
MASYILAENRPFAPANKDRFTTFLNPDWKDAAPVETPSGPALDEAATRSALRAFLERRFPCDASRVQDGLAVYGDPDARMKVPEPTLRAALAALTGTVGEPAIDFLLHRTPVGLVSFGIYVDPITGLSGHVGEAGRSPDGTRYITIDRRFRFLPFGALSALLAHEALHTGQDEDMAGYAEETVAYAIESLVYMEMLLTDPSLALLNDELTRWNNNHLALVRINSGPPGSDRLTLFVPGGTTNIDPLGAEPLTQYADLPANNALPDPAWRDRETAGNWLLSRILERLAMPGTVPPADGAGFDAATLAFVDANQAVLSPAEVIDVACILELDLRCP